MNRGAAGAAPMSVAEIESVLVGSKITEDGIAEIAGRASDRATNG